MTLFDHLRTLSGTNGWLIQFSRFFTLMALDGPEAGCLEWPKFTVPVHAAAVHHSMFVL